MSVGLQAFAAQSVSAQTYNDAINNLLQNKCIELQGDSFRVNGRIIGIEGELGDLCDNSSGGVTPGSSSSSGGSGAATVQFAARIVGERLGRAREAEREQGGQGGGSSSDTVIDLGGGFGVFVSGGYESRNKNNNRFEDGWDSDIWNATGGVDYKFTDWLVAGVAFNYANFDANYDDGGNFETDSYGGIVYASVLPTERSFVDLTLGYSRQDLDRRRNAFFDPDDTISGDETFGRVKSDYDANEFNASFFSGYDFPIDNFTIGPRLGLSWVQIDEEGYREKGNTGLELDINSDTRTSVQSRLGFLATAAFSTDFGVLFPQFGAVWVHEYAMNDRNVKARFVDDKRANPTRFEFKRENPIRDWGELNLGLSAVLPNGLQPFANFGTYVGNGRFSSYAGTLGMRVDW